MLHTLRKPLTRRQALRQCAVGFGSLAVAEMLAGASAAPIKGPLEDRPPHFPARAKRIIFLNLNLIADVLYAKELFATLIPLRIQ